MDPKYTPGPWRIGKCYGSVVADFPVPGIRGSDETESYGGHLVAESISTQNRALIAAAPDLLEALVEMVEWLEQGDHEGPMHTRARAAIAKATGE